jgi:hypothetical protein
MSDHKNNPISVLARKATPKSVEDVRALASAVEVGGYTYGFEVAIEPNKAKMAEITKMLDDAKAAGKSPQDVDLSFELKPEEKDYVVYHQVQQIRQLKIINQTMVVKLRGPEHFRMPMTEILARAQHQIDGGPAEAKA